MFALISLYRIIHNLSLQRVVNANFTLWFINWQQFVFRRLWTNRLSLYCLPSVHCFCPDVMESPHISFVYSDAQHISLGRRLDLKWCSFPPTSELPLASRTKGHIMAWRLSCPLTCDKWDWYYNEETHLWGEIAKGQITVRLAQVHGVGGWWAPLLWIGTISLDCRRSR